MSHESNKQRWRRDGTVHYISVEARPARKGGDGYQSVLDWCPAGDSGACEAFQALQQAVTAKRTPEEAAAFYRELLAWATAQRG